jgi:type VI protein secretion system component Hcp
MVRRHTTALAPGERRKRPAAIQKRATQRVEQATTNQTAEVSPVSVRVGVRVPVSVARGRAPPLSQVHGTCLFGTTRFGNRGVAMTFRMRQSWRWLVALGAMLVPAVVTGALELPFTFEAGNAIKASEVNANFQALAAKIDAASVGAPNPVVGTLTIAGVLTDAEIRKFSQSIDVAWSPGSVLGKPQLSRIVIERDLGEGTPGINRNLCLSKALATASIVLGNLTIDLTQVSIVDSSLATPRGGAVQETIALAYNALTYTWRDTNEPERAVTYDIAKSVGGSNATQAFVFGYFPAGVAPADGYTPITSAEHQIGCATAGCKPQHAPLSLSKQFEVGTLDTLGLVLSGKSGSSVDVDFFADADTVSNGVQLDGVVVTGVELSTDASGALNEKASFGYQTINWVAGNVSHGWDVVANKEL